MTTQTTTPKQLVPHSLQWAVMGITVASLLAGCGTPPRPEPTVPPPWTGTPAPSPAPAPTPAVTGKTSAASSPRDYRRDAASHIYALNGQHIYTGKLPPLLYAVGVLEVEVDSRGNVNRINWLRAPTHAPEVMTQIETMVRKAAPYPAPVRLGRVTYTDTWLWHKSGKFQLDTLTEGQM